MVMSQEFKLITEFLLHISDFDFFVCFVLAAWHDMKDLSSLIRDQIGVPCFGDRES